MLQTTGVDVDYDAEIRVATGSFPKAKLFHAPQRVMKSGKAKD